MNATQFSMAMEIAQDKNFTYIDGNGKWTVDCSAFDGCGLPEFDGPIYVTLEQVAAFVKYQAMQMNGEWNAIELQNIAVIGRKHFIIIGRGGPKSTTVEDEIGWWNTQAGNHPLANYIPATTLRGVKRDGHWYAEVSLGDLRITGVGENFQMAIANCHANVTKHVFK